MNCLKKFKLVILVVFGVIFINSSALTQYTVDLGPTYFQMRTDGLLFSENIDSLKLALEIYKETISKVENGELTNEHYFRISFNGISYICQNAIFRKGFNELGDLHELLKYLKEKAYAKDDSESTNPNFRHSYMILLYGLDYIAEAKLEYDKIMKLPYLTTAFERYMLTIMYELYYVKYEPNSEETKEVLRRLKEIFDNVPFFYDHTQLPDDPDSLLRIADGLNYSAEGLIIYKLIVTKYRDSDVGSKEYYAFHSAINALVFPFCAEIRRRSFADEFDVAELLEFIKAHTKENDNAIPDIKMKYLQALNWAGYYNKVYFYECVFEYEELLKAPNLSNEYVLSILETMYSIYVDLLNEPYSEKAKEILRRIKELDENRGNELENITKGSQNQSIVSLDKTTIPTDYSLSQNYPNPFNPTTKIEYSLIEDSKVRLTVYNSLGQEVLTLVNGNQVAGRYTVNVNVKNLPSGIYFYQLQSDNFNAVKKMMLIK